MRETSHNLVPRPPLISSWINTERAEPTSKSMKTEQFSLANQNIWFLWIRLVHLQQAIHPMGSDLEHCHDRIQKDDIIIRGSIIQRLITWSSHQCQDRRGPPLMMFLPCPPWAGWYGVWVPPPMHFHLGWSGPIGGFDH
jgi:hypothetical protein